MENDGKRYYYYCGPISIVDWSGFCDARTSLLVMIIEVEPYWLNGRLLLIGVVRMMLVDDGDGGSEN